MNVFDSKMTMTEEIYVLQKDLNDTLKQNDFYKTVIEAQEHEHVATIRIMKEAKTHLDNHQPEEARKTLAQFLKKSGVAKVSNK